MQKRFFLISEITADNINDLNEYAMVCVYLSLMHVITTSHKRNSQKA
jgi:hypothetical protein